MRRSLTVILFLLLLTASDGSAMQSQPFMKIPLKDLNGNVHTIENEVGRKLTFIIFWATWSRDSGTMLSLMQEIFVSERENGVNVISLCVEQEIPDDSLNDRVSKVLAANRVSFVNIFDDRLTVFRSLNIIAVPTILVLDSLRQIETQISGYSLSSRNQIMNIIQRSRGEHLNPTASGEKKGPVKEAIRYFNMAKMDLRKGKVEKGKEYLRKSLQIDSTFVQPYVILCELAIEAEQWSEASDWISKLMVIDRSGAETQGLAEMIAYHRGEKEKALISIQQKLKLDSLSVPLLIHRAYLLGMEGNFKESFTVFQKAERIDSADVRLYKRRLTILKRSGDSSAAARDSVKVRSFMGR